MPGSDMSANPYSAPEGDLAMADGPANLADMEYLGFWPRVVASIIDNIITGIAGVPIGIACGLMGQGAVFFGQILGFVMGIAYVLVFWNWKGATPGKMAFNAVIVDAKTGAKPSGGTYVVRYLGYIPSILVLGLGFLWVAWDPQKRGWHDMLAGTIVVRPRHGLRTRDGVRTPPQSLG